MIVFFFNIVQNFQEKFRKKNCSSIQDIQQVIFRNFLKTTNKSILLN